MTNFAIFTASTKNREAYRHFVKTISNSYKFSNSKNLTKEQMESLIDLYPSGEARFWGSRPGSKSQWKKLRPGDVVYIWQDGYFIFSAIVTYIFHNLNFAKEVWGTHSKTGQVWEYVYFLDEFESIYIKEEMIANKLNYGLMMKKQNMLKTVIIILHLTL